MRSNDYQMLASSQSPQHTIPRLRIIPAGRVTPPPMPLSYTLLLDDVDILHLA